MCLVHIGADIAVVSVACEGKIIEKHIWALQSELKEPAVL